MKVFLIGAAGDVGRRLARTLTTRGDHVTGMHRDPAQADTITDTGATPVVGDLIADSVDELAAKFAGHDAVVFSAGAHGTGLEQTTLIDGAGAKKAADAAAAAGIRRFVLVSAFPDSERGGRLGATFEHYMRVKKDADVHLAATELDWVIVRPGTLTDEPGTEHVTAGAAVAYGPVPRDDVAAFIAAVLHEPAIRREIIELTTGPTRIADAAASLVRARQPIHDTPGQSR